jgi:hypothetical protein
VTRRCRNHFVQETKVAAVEELVIIALFEHDRQHEHRTHDENNYWSAVVTLDHGLKNKNKILICDKYERRGRLLTTLVDQSN